MSNIERGEIDIDVTRTIGGITETRVYTLKLSMNAAIKMQTRHKKKMGELLADAEALDFAVIRDIVFVLLQKHHSDEIKSLEDAELFIDDAGGVKVFFDTLEKLSKTNKTTGEGGAANPPQAPTSGIGAVSSETPVASV